MSESVRMVKLVVSANSGWIGWMADSIMKKITGLRNDITATARQSFQRDEQGNYVQSEEALAEQASWNFSHITIDTSIPENEWMFGLSKEDLLAGDNDHEPVPEYLYLDVMTGEIRESEF